MMMRYVLTLGVCVALAAPSYGQVISVSFAGDNGGGNSVSIGGLDPTPAVAGFIPAANWNSDDFFLDEGFIQDLFDDSGETTTAAVEWSGSANTWGGTGATTEDEMMVNGWLDDNGAGATVEVTGIPYENYDLYVYGSSDAGNAGRGFTTQVNGVDYFSNGVFEDPISDNGSYYFPEVGYVNALNVTNNPNYFKIGALSGEELTIFGGRNQVGPEEPNGITDFRGVVSGFQIVACDGECEDIGIPPSSVAGLGIGNQALSGSRSNQVFGPAGENVPGLGQSWFAVANPGSKEALDNIFLNNDTAVPYFQADGGTSWWSGSTPVTGVPQYPAEVDGVITGDNYSVKLEGEILIEESRSIQFLDGVDDFAYLAIDTDRSGIAGDSDAEVLINDNVWTGALGSGNGGAPIVEVEFEDIADGGEWLAIEFNMAEGGGGDSGMLFWNVPDVDDQFFPLAQDDGVLEGDAEFLLIADDFLRSPSTPPELLSSDLSASIPASASGWEFEIDVAGDTADAFVLENPDADVFSTTLDVDGADFFLNVDGDVVEGDSFQIVVADNITGTPTISPEGWSFDASTGSVVFGELSLCNPDTMGDLDGSGDVAFADFLILSNNFGSEVSSHTEGDIDCSGDVAFADFLVLSNNFGQAVGAEASSVPEPSSWALLCLAGLCVGLVRRRR